MAAVGELPEIHFVRGDDLTYSFNMFLRDDQGVTTPYDLSSVTDIRMDFRNKPTKDGALIIRLTLGSGITIGGVNNNKVTITLSEVDTALFDPNVFAFVTPELGKKTSLANNRYYTDIAFFFGSEVITLLKAKVLVTANITDEKTV
jgi:hypothetical protein